MFPFRQDLKTTDRPPYTHRPSSLKDHFRLKHRMNLEDDWDKLLAGAAPLEVDGQDSEDSDFQYSELDDSEDDNATKDIDKYVLLCASRPVKQPDEGESSEDEEHDDESEDEDNEEEDSQEE